MAIVSYKTLGQVRSGSASKRLVATQRSVTNNLITITTATTHSLSVGDRVYLNGAGGAVDGTQVVTSACPTSNTFTYPTTSASAAPANLASCYFQMMRSGGVRISNITRTNNILTVTTSENHNATENQYVYLATGTVASAYGLYKVLDTPTATSFRVVSFGTNISSTAFTDSDNLAAVNVVPAVTIYQPGENKSALISSIVLFNATEQNSFVDLYQTASTAFTSLSSKDDFLLQGEIVLAPKETYSVNLAITIADQQRIVMCADTPGIYAYAYGTEFE